MTREPMDVDIVEHRISVESVGNRHHPTSVW